MSNERQSQFRTVLSAAVVSLSLAAGLWTSAAGAASCTDGVDCYCDRVRKSGDALYDPALLLCEDFEAKTLYEDPGKGGKTNGAGEAIHGPWYDDSGYTGAWGFNSYWTRTYGSTIGGCAVRRGEPSGASVGAPCAFDTCFAREWRADNRWGVNKGACIDVQRAGDARAEVSTLKDPGIYDGAQVFSYRVEAGRANGIVGEKTFTCNGGPCTEIGVTMATAYASNVAASKIWDAPWKHEEWGSTGMSFWMHGNTGAGDASVLPYRPFLMLGKRTDGRYQSVSQTRCNQIVSNAKVNRGQLACGCGSDGCNAIRYAADPTVYSQSRDWPWGSWACSRGHIKGLGTASGSIKLWHNDTLVVDIANLDLREMMDQSFNYMNFNAYSNANQGMGEGSGPTSQTTYRYLDDFHARNGAPVSCSGVIPETPPGDDPPPQATTPPASPILLE